MPDRRRSRRRRRALVLVLATAALLPVGARPAGAVAGGTPADPGEWPWQVLLLVEGGAWCGGSLLAPDIVLTAAHCTDGMDAGAFEVLAGTVEVDGDGQRRDVAQIDQHEGYDDVEIRNDLSLLVLASPFELGEDIAVVQLADADTTAALAEEGDRAVVTGFGATGEIEEPSDVLLEAEVQTYADDRCESLYAEDGEQVFGDTQVCAGDDRGHIDACFGDSGGPLVVPADDERTEWFQIGIVSWGAGCGQPRRPTIYTEVAAFADWLGSRGVGPEGSQRFEGGGARIPARGSVGKASRYPLTIEVDGFEGDLEAASVRLVGLRHENPEDLDIWLVAPDGTVVTLLSDVGGGDELAARSILVVADANPASGFDLEAQISPSDRERDDQRKGARSSTDFDDLEGLDPNGEWQLLVADDHRGGVGHLDSWSLQLR
jgi:trypsin